MRILFLAQHYAPEEVSGAILATELASDLTLRGHDVKFVTCAPNYPDGVVFPGYQNRLLARERIGGVEVLRVWSYISTKKSFWRRVLNYSTFSLMALFGGLAAGQVDAVFCYSPPLTLGIAGWLVSKIRGVPWVLRVEDLYPEAAVVAGVLRNKMVIRIFEKLEAYLYHVADHISLISEGFREKIITQGVQEDKLSVAPVWADTDWIQPLPKENKFRKEQMLNGKFVVLYAGNLGHASSLDSVLEAAELLKELPTIQFLIVGEGVKKKYLQEKASLKDLDNVRFLQFQPRECYANMLAAADVGLVTLNERSAYSSLPSKTFNIMASGRPVLAIAPQRSDLAEVVNQSDCGIVVEPGMADHLGEVIKKLASNPEEIKRMGMNGRHALEGKYSRTAVINQFSDMMDNLVYK